MTPLYRDHLVRADEVFVCEPVRKSADCHRRNVRR